jgi:hypothetical protein
MKNTDSNLDNLSYRGNGFFVYDDNSNPRMNDIDIAKKVGKHLSKRVTHIAHSPYVGYIRHILQYSHLFQKDQNRLIDQKKQLLADKFN